MPFKPCGAAQAISGHQQQYEVHILRPGNTAPLETLFCWHGFIYVRVTPTGKTGFKGTLESIVGLKLGYHAHAV